MSRIPQTAASRITRHTDSNAIRTWFNPYFHPDVKTGEEPEEVARRVLSDSADLFEWKKNLPDIVDERVVVGPGSESVRFAQTFKRIPVDSSEIVVNLDARRNLHSIYNNYHYGIPRSLDPKDVKVDEWEALRIAEELLSQHEKRDVFAQRLVVYRFEYVSNSTGKPGQGLPQRIRALASASEQHATSAETGFIPVPGAYYLAWDIRIRTSDPGGAWRVLVDAVSGRLLNLIDLSQYATGTAKVFDPNPIVTSGDTTLRHTSPAATINNERVSVTVERLDPPSGGNLHLSGPHVKMQEEENPNIPDPANAGGTFTFNWDDNSFLDGWCTSTSTASRNTSRRTSG